MRGPASARPPVPVPAALAALTALALLLAGCTGGTDAPTSPSGGCGDATCPSPSDDYPGKPKGADALEILGIVHDEALMPVAGARLTIQELGLRATADAQGQFAFLPVEPAIYSVRAEAPGYHPATLTARPAGGALEFILASAGPLRPYNHTIPFHGYLECAAEYVIISGPCDLLLMRGGQEPVFQNQSAFEFPVDPMWATLVFDVRFDASQNPLMDGLRLTVRGADDAADTGAYEQYGRFHGPSSFSFRMEPGGNYTDGTGPVPSNATAFHVDVYPQGKAYHEVCDPTPIDGRCFLGVGFGTNLRFDVYVTVFYLEPAPEGFSRLA